MSLGCTFLYLMSLTQLLGFSHQLCLESAPLHLTGRCSLHTSPCSHFTCFSHHKKLRSIGYLLRWGLTLKTWQVNKGTHKRPHWRFHVHEKSGAGKSAGTGCRLKVTWGERGRERDWGLDRFLGGRGGVCVCVTYSGIRWRQRFYNSESSINHWSVHFTMVNFM